MRADSPDVVITKRLLDHLKLRGFQFRRVAPGEDGPLVGNRVTGDWADLIHIEGFSRDCFAWRKRKSSLIVPGDGLLQRRVNGSALTVLNAVLTWETGSRLTSSTKSTDLHYGRRQTNTLPLDRRSIVDFEHPSMLPAFGGWLVFPILVTSRQPPNCCVARQRTRSLHDSSKRQVDCI